MSLPNEVPATLTLWGWREGRYGEHGREDISPAGSACHAGCSDQPISPVKLKPCHLGCQPPIPPTGVWTLGVSGGKDGCSTFKKILRPHRARMSFNSMNVITTSGAEEVDHSAFSRGCLKPC